ncbi:hypothetical protein EJB05_54575, partial [Eragrostis curvula]
MRKRARSRIWQRPMRNGGRINERSPGTSPCDHSSDWRRRTAARSCGTGAAPLLQLRARASQRERGGGELVWAEDKVEQGSMHLDRLRLGAMKLGCGVELASGTTSTGQFAQPEEGGGRRSILASFFNEYAAEAFLKT